MYSRRRSSLLLGIVPVDRVGTSLSSLLLFEENDVSPEPLAVSLRVIRFGAGVHQSVSAPSSVRLPSVALKVVPASARAGCARPVAAGTARMTLKTSAMSTGMRE